LVTIWKLRNENNGVFEWVKRAVSEFVGEVVFHGIDTFDKEIFLEW
jgi:hypothetical protein